jgi:methionine-rich copper-binding protein CopC
MRLRFVLGHAMSLALLLGVPALAMAHTDLIDSSPADGAQLDEPPTEVVLTFESEIGDESSFTVADADGSEVGSGELDLDVAERNVLRGEVSITEDGTYAVAYMIIGEDGDPIEGEVTFTVGEVDAGAPPPPDTALPAPGSPLNASVLGVGLLLVSGGLALRTRLARG